MKHQNQKIWSNEEVLMSLSNLPAGETALANLSVLKNELLNNVVKELLNEKEYFKFIDFPAVLNE